MADEEPAEHRQIERPSVDLDLDWDGLVSLLNGANTRCLLWQVAGLADSVELADDEIDVLLKMPPSFRMKITASLLDYALTIREMSRNLDAQLMRLTGELV